ncbi:MAG: inositol monophosphatase family protein [Candidatus Limnocylindrales bacterium]
MLTFVQLESIAVEAATGGARTVRDSAGDLGAVEAKSTPTDPVTSLDVAVEREIRTTLARRAPHSSVLGEEGGAIGGSSGVGWVVDPIDGTVNLTYGLPIMSVSIAATWDGDVVAGAVVDIHRGDIFSAARGHGARLDGSTIEPTQVTSLADSLIGTGFAYTARGRAEEAVYLARVLPAGRDIRCFGSAALNLCWVASGRLDGFYQRNMQYWDFAAGEIIAAEAGAKVARPSSGNDRLMVVTAPGIHDELVRLVS